MCVCVCMLYSENAKRIQFKLICGDFEKRNRIK